VQNDAAQTAEQLAALVNLSASAAQRRLNRLKDAGVIRQEVAVVSHEAVGRPFLLIVEVEVENEHEPAATQFVRRLTGAPEVMQCYYVTGQADYILGCTFRDMSEYEAFSQKMFVEAPNVVSFQTSVVISPLKMTLRVPVGEDRG
jgi:Lrp/AsnC family leucine-responsive transcriptional regulator